MYVQCTPYIIRHLMHIHLIIQFEEYILYRLIAYIYSYLLTVYIYYTKTICVISYSVLDYYCLIITPIDNILSLYTDVYNVHSLHQYSVHYTVYRIQCTVFTIHCIIYTLYMYILAIYTGIINKYTFFHVYRY